MYNWQKYNIKSNKLSLNFEKFNNENFFNKIENSYYNHTRDLFCLSLTKLKKKKNNICLDYGSNMMSISNIKNKIDAKRYKFFIFNPFLDKFRAKKLAGVQSTELKNLKNFNYKIDFLNFGSSLQYLQEPFKIFEQLKFNKESYILITATPFCSNKNYKSEQKNHPGLDQNIINLKILNKFLNKINFKLIFKSSMNINNASIKNLKKNTFFLNLLFEKN
jgi:hypothetical protein